MEEWRMNGVLEGRGARVMAWLCVLALIVSVLPLYAISLYNHPYYDDFGFAQDVHHAWVETHDVGAALKAAVRSIRDTRQTWQGTFTGTIFSNLQPGVFEESWYFLSSFFLLTAFLGCFAFFFHTVFGYLGAGRYGRMALSALALTLLCQLMPDPGEAFYWFNGGVGNLFVYSLLALSVALSVRLMDQPVRKKRIWLMLALCPVMVLLGGGSYSGGLFGLCLYGLALLWMLVRRHPRRWHFAALWLVFAAFFLYSVSAPGNQVRASYIRYSVSPVKAVLQALYYGTALMGQYIHLPLVGITVMAWPFLWQAARSSRYDFRHPWLITFVMGGLFCTQLTPPLYSIASIGDGRIVNTYFISFVCLWLLWVYYMTGFIARRLKPAFAPRSLKAFVLTGLCLAGIGCMGIRIESSPLYGVQNLNGAQAALSILSGEAARYHREMSEREALLSDPAQTEVTLKPLTAVPSVLMEDLLRPDAVYDVRPTLMKYYHKEVIHIQGEEETP